MLQSCRNFLEFGISRRTLENIHLEIDATAGVGEIEVEVSLGDEHSFYSITRQNRPAIQYTPNTSEHRFASVVRELSEFESTFARITTEHSDYTVQRHRRPHEHVRCRTFSDGRRVHDEKTTLFSVDDLLSNTRMKCSHEKVIDDERVIQSLVPASEPERYHRQSFLYYESGGERPLAQFDCTTKRTATTTKYNIELEFHMAEVRRICPDYESTCLLFERLSKIVDPYIQRATRSLQCGHWSYQVPNRQLPITLQKTHVVVLQSHEYAATPKFDGTRRYIIFDTKAILDATTSDPMEVRPICHGRLSEYLAHTPHPHPAGNPPKTTSLIILDTEFMSDGTYHVFDVIRDTTRNTHQRSLHERMQFVYFVCKEYQTLIMDKNPDAPAIIPKQMFFDGLSCAIGAIRHQYLNSTYQIDGVIFVPVHGSYEETCDKARVDPVLKFKPRRLLTIDFGINLRDLDALPEGDKSATTVYVSSGRQHVDVRCVLPKYRFDWVDMYALLRSDGAEGVPFDSNGLCIVECNIVHKADVTHISPIRIRKDKAHANSRHVVSSNLQSIRELTEAELEIARRSGDSTDLDDLSVIQYWLDGPRYAPVQVGLGHGGELAPIDAELVASIDGAYANKRVLFASPRNVFENFQRTNSTRMLLLQDDGCRRVTCLPQIRSELVLAEHERAFHAIYIVCILDATTAQWAASKLLPERIARCLTGGGVCVLLMPKDDNLASFAPISGIVHDANMQCHTTSRFPNWTAYVYRRRQSSSASSTSNPRLKVHSGVHAPTSSTSLADAQNYFNANAQRILDSYDKAP
jgi:hypothetical protein